MSNYHYIKLDVEEANLYDDIVSWRQELNKVGQILL